MSSLAAQVDLHTEQQETEPAALCTYVLRPDLYLSLLYRTFQAFQGSG